MEDNGSINEFALINSLLRKLPSTWVVKCMLHMFFNGWELGVRHCTPNW